MGPRVGLAIFGAAALLVGTAGLARAETPTAEEVRAVAATTPPVRVPCRDPWEVALRIPVWIPGVTGTLASGTSELKPQGDGGGGVFDRLFDTVTSLQFAFMGGVEVRKGRWSAVFDGFYVDVSSELEWTLDGDPVLSAGLDAFLLRGSVGYEVARWRLGRTCLTAEAYAGLRFYAVGFRAETATQRVDRDTTWADPIVGGRLRWRFARQFEATLAADVGGFGIGSDVSWSLLAAVEWRFARCWSLEVGWSVLDIDYAVGSGDRRFDWDLRLEGPLLSVAYRF